MIHKISVRVSNEVFRSLREESLKNGVKLSDVVRCRLIQPNEARTSRKIFDSDESFFLGITGTEKDQTEPNVGPRSESEFAAIETLYLLREFLFERNAQILRRVDGKME